jgi:hypothetical protein
MVVSVFQIREINGEEASLSSPIERSTGDDGTAHSRTKDVHGPRSVATRRT